MTNRRIELSQRAVAIIAGIAFLLMTAASVFVFFYVLKQLTVPGDAATTANRIIASERLFRVGIYGLILIILCDMIVSWSLYIFLRQADNSLSLLAMLLRLSYAVLLGSALFNLIDVLHYIGNPMYREAFGASRLHAHILFSIETFYDDWAVGLILFGCHLLVLGYLVFKSGYTPKIIGLLLIIGSFGYSVENSATILCPNFENYKAVFEMVLALPMAIGELSLAFWLLLRGGKGQGHPATS